MCSIVPEHSELTSLDLYSSIVNGAAGKAKNGFYRLPGKDSFLGKNIPEALSVCPSLYHNIFSLCTARYVFLDADPLIQGEGPLVFFLCETLLLICHLLCVMAFVFYQSLFPGLVLTGEDASQMDSQEGSVEDP